MSNYVTSITSLNYPKTDQNALPSGADSTKYVAAADWNLVNQAADDIRSHLANGAGLSFVTTATIPAVGTGATGLLWCDRTTSTTLRFYDGASSFIKLSQGQTVGGFKLLNAGNYGIEVHNSANEIDFLFAAVNQWYMTAIAFNPVTDLAGGIGESGRRLTGIWSRQYNHVQTSTAFSVSSVTFNVANGEIQTVDMTDSIPAAGTLVFTSANPGNVMTVFFYQKTSTGTINAAAWPANVKLAGGAVTLTATNAKTDALTFRYFKDYLGADRWVEIARSLNL